MAENNGINKLNGDTGWIIRSFSNRIFINYHDLKDSGALNSIAGTINTMSNAVKDRVQAIQGHSRAMELEAYLNNAYNSAKAQGLIDKIALQLANTMSGKAFEGLESFGLGLNGLSGVNYSKAANQAVSVYDYGVSKGVKYNNPDVKNPVIPGGINDVGSSNYFLNLLNNGDLKTIEQIRNAAQGYINLSNYNGQLLERFIQLVGSVAFNAGASVSGEVASNIEKFLASGGNLGTIQSLGDVKRNVIVDIDENTARVYDSQQKVDATMNFKFSDSKSMELITISAKSRSKKTNNPIKLLEHGNLMGLLANAGIQMTKQFYSSLTVYTDNPITATSFDRIIFMQAMAGTTGIRGKTNTYTTGIKGQNPNTLIFDQADYMVYQVGTATDAHFRVVSVADTFIHHLDDIMNYADIKYEPSPPPIGANVHGIDDNGSRTESTMVALMEASVSVTLKAGYLQLLYSS